MSRNGLSAGLLFVLLGASGCTGGSGGLLADPSGTGAVPTASSSPSGGVTATTTETSSTSITPVVAGEVGPDGLAVALPDGGSIDVPPGALPVGATIDVEPVDPASITPPEGTTVVGPALRITASAQPEEPVFVEVPIPVDAPRTDLWLLHVGDDGASEIIGGSVTGDLFVGAVRSFSEVALLHGQVTEILGIAGVPGVEVSFEEGAAPDGPLTTEQAQLFTGERTEPARRVVRIVGPGELGTRNQPTFGRYSAVGFQSRVPRFVEYTWRVFGGDGLRIGEQRGETLDVTASRTGRYTITVDALDPATGATAFAAHRVFVTEGFVISLQADRPGGYCCGEQASITLDYIGGANPVVTEWTAGDQQFPYVFDDVQSPPYTWVTSEVTEDILVTVVGTDGAGATSSTQYLIPYRPRGPAAMILGPAEVRVGEEARFTAETDRFPARNLRWLAWPQGAGETAGNEMTITWDEPGVGRVGVFVWDEEQGALDPTPVDVVPVSIVGDPLPVAVRVPTAPTDLSPGQPGEWGIRVRGGIVAAATGFRGYTVTVDFGDNSAPLQVEVPTSTAAVLTDPFPVSHVYEEPGEYTVTVTAMSPDGASATEEYPVTVTDEIVLQGEFTYEMSLNTPVWRVNENEIELVIRGTEVEITRFANDTDRTYVGFTLGGGATTPDCTFNQVYSLTDSDLTFDPATQTITGEVRVRSVRSDDAGSNCPFGGRTGVDEVLESEIYDAVIVDGTITDGWIFGFFTASVVEDT